MSLEPAKSTVALFGGPAVVSEITGTAYTAPYRWMAPRENGGTGGVIPQKHFPALLAAARERGLVLTTDDLVFGVGAASHVQSGDAA